MPQFPEIQSLTQEDLILPLKGKDGTVRQYRIEAATAAVTILSQVAMFAAKAGGELQLTAEDAALLDQFGTVGQAMSKVFGETTFRSMIADEVSGPDIQHAYAVAMWWHAGDTDGAMRLWTGGKAQTPQRAGKTRSGGAGAAARTTKRRASTSGTTTRQSRKAKAAPTSGPTSGDTST